MRRRSTLPLLLTALAGSAFTAPPVSSVVTLPSPPHGSGTAFAAELVIAFGMMATILTVSSSRLAACTGVFAGLLVATYISVEAPFSGMSINPARTFASALPSGVWTHFWLYLLAPVAGMQLGSVLHGLRTGPRGTGCAKLIHSSDQRCIHCGFEPSRPIGELP